MVIFLLKLTFLLNIATNISKNSTKI